jgi:DNA-binding CsgD family transcriptional regulator
MNRMKPIERARHLSLVAARARVTPPAQADATSASDAPLPAPVAEVVIDGRRYRLVPADVETPSERGRLALAEILTARELQIAALVAEGRVNKQIAAELKISEWTVSTHLRRIFAKLNVDTRAAMVTKCFDTLSSMRRDS